MSFCVECQSHRRKVTPAKIVSTAASDSREKKVKNTSPLCCAHARVCELADTMSSSDKLTKFKRLRKGVNNCNDKKKRREFIRQLVLLISDWKSELPNLRDVFRPTEINQLLIDAVEIIFTGKHESEGIEIVAFVVSTGYRDEPAFDKNNRPLLHCRTPLLHVASYLPSINARETVRDLFKIYDKFDVNYIAHNDVTHFHVACAYGLRDIAEKFLDSRQDINCRDRNNDTPLLMATLHGEKEVAKLLLKRGANVAVFNTQRKTPLHFICQKYRGDHDLVQSLFKINDDMRQRMRINAPDNKGNTALHLVLEYGREIEKTIDLLLRRGFDPTLANAEGKVPLLEIFWTGKDSLVKILIKAIDRRCRSQRRQTYPVNFQDRQGNTALHHVLERHRNNAWFVWLLKKGADPNLVNDQGVSPVDLICSSWRYGADDKMFRSLVEHCNVAPQALNVNAKDKSGRILLNWALENREKMKVEWLLRTGVDPNLADRQGSTAMHVISQQRNDYGFAELLFKICDENRRTVQVDAKDKSDRTPIEYAVANFHPNIVAALLDHGASLVWPTGSHFDEVYNQRNPPFEYKFTRVIGALAVMECLENRDYEFERSKALRIMKYFDEFKMFADLENDQYDVATFSSSSAKSMMIKPSLSLHDLIQSSPQEAWKRLTYQDCYDYWSSINVCAFSLRSRVISARVICEKMSRCRFFRTWALVSYLELIRYRLPLECCEMIIDRLTDRDLLNICLSASDDNVNSEEQRIRVSVPETK